MTFLDINGVPCIKRCQFLIDASDGAVLANLGEPDETAGKVIFTLGIFRSLCGKEVIAGNDVDWFLKQRIRTPVFSVGTVRDHVAPWKSVYKILLLTESDVTFVLTSGGHNAGIVSEPKHKGRSYQISTMPATARYTPPGAWQTNTPTKEGSWWEEWQNWLDIHSNGKIKPPSMGSKEYPSICDAPGSYVMMT